MLIAGVEGTLPLEPWYIGGPVIKGFGRGSKVLGIPTGVVESIFFILWLIQPDFSLFDVSLSGAHSFKLLMVCHF